MVMFCIVAVDISLIAIWLFVRRPVKRPVLSNLLPTTRNKVVINHGLPLLILGFAGMAIYQLDSLALCARDQRRFSSCSKVNNVNAIAQSGDTYSNYRQNFRPGSTTVEKFLWLATGAALLSLACMLSFLSSGAELISVIFGGNYGADPTVNL